MKLYTKVIADRLETLERENAELRKENGKLRAFKSFIGNLNLQVYIKDVVRLPNDNYLFPFSYVNKKQAAVLHAQSPEAALGKTDADFFGAGSDEKTHTDEVSIVKTQLPFSAEESLELTDGTHYDFSAIKTPYIDDHGHVQQILGVSIDITQEVLLREAVKSKNRELARANRKLKEQKEELQQLALIDELTEMATRRLLIATSISALEGAKRHNSPPEYVGFIYIDLDHLKNINDTHGHNAGDEAIKCISKEIIKATRATDTCARYGGDEFVILCTGIKNPEEINIIENRFKQAIDNIPCKINDRLTLSLSGSTGNSIYTYTGPGEKDTRDTPGIFASLLKEADEKMYADKVRKKAER